MATKRELIAALQASNPEIASADLELVLDSIFDFLKVQLAQKQRIEIRGFGVFELRQRKIVSKLLQTAIIRNVVHFKPSSSYDL